MFKTQFFYCETQIYLQDIVNEFIKDKNVISISYTAAPYEYGYRHCCCVLYEE